jgi:hypothetical protein
MSFKELLLRIDGLATNSRRDTTTLQIRTSDDDDDMVAAVFCFPLHKKSDPKLFNFRSGEGQTEFHWEADAQ